MWKEEEGSRLELYADEKGEDGRRAHAVGRASPRKQLEGLRDVAPPQEEPLRISSTKIKMIKRMGLKSRGPFFLAAPKTQRLRRLRGLKGALGNDLPQGHPGGWCNWPRAEETEAARLG